MSPPELSKIQEILHRIEAKPRGVKADINKDQKELGVAFVLVCSKPAIDYLKYMLNALNQGVTVYYIMARGYNRIAKAREIMKIATSGEKARFRVHEERNGFDKIIQSPPGTTTTVVNDDDNKPEGTTVVPTLAITLVAIPVTVEPRKKSSTGSAAAQIIDTPLAVSGEDL